MLRFRFRYMYLDHVPEEKKTIVPLIHAANKYMIIGLVETCMNVIIDIIDTENACAVLDTACMLDELVCFETCLSFILKNGELCLTSQGFTELSRDSLKKIVESDDLLADELSLWDALVRWARSNCIALGVLDTTTEIRDVLGDLVYHVRFRGIGEKEFAEKVSATQILTLEEEKTIANFGVDASENVERFSKKPSRLRLSKCCRFRKVQTFNRNRGQDEVCFAVSTPVVLCGIVLFKYRTTKRHYIISVNVLDALNDYIISLQTAADIRHDDSETFDVLFPRKLKLTENQIYTISIDVKEKEQFYGVEVNNEVNADGVIFTFCPSGKAANKTKRHGVYFGTNTEGNIELMTKQPPSGPGARIPGLIYQKNV